MDGDTTVRLLRLKYSSRTWEYEHPSQAGSRPGLSVPSLHRQDRAIARQGAAGAQELEINTLPKVEVEGMSSRS